MAKTRKDTPISFRPNKQLREFMAHNLKRGRYKNKTQLIEHAIKVLIAKTKYDYECSLRSKVRSKGIDPDAIAPIPMPVHLYHEISTKDVENIPVTVYDAEKELKTDEKPDAYSIIEPAKYATPTPTQTTEPVAIPDTAPVSPTPECQRETCPESCQAQPDPVADNQQPGPVQPEPSPATTEPQPAEQPANTTTEIPTSFPVEEQLPQAQLDPSTSVNNESPQAQSV